MNGETLLLAIIGALSLVASYATIRTSRNKQTLQNFRDAAQAAQALAASQAAQIADLTSRLAAALDQIALLQSKVAALEDLATGKTQLEILSVQVDKNFTKMSVLIGDQFTQSRQQIADSVQKILRAVADGSL